LKSAILKTKKGIWVKWIPLKVKIDFPNEGKLNRFLQNAVNSNAHHHEKLVMISFLDFTRSLNQGPLQIAQLSMHQPSFILTTFTISFSVEARLRDHLNR
jgi:hypothetical protein